MNIINSNISQAEDIKILANEAFKGEWIFLSIMPFFACQWTTSLFCCWICNYFSAHKYSQAIDLYTQAIEVYNENAVYWANRSFAHTKLEKYGSAVEDASRAVEIDPDYSKAGFLSSDSDHWIYS